MEMLMNQQRIVGQRSQSGTQHLRISWYFLGFRLNVFLANWDDKAEVPGKTVLTGKKKKRTEGTRKAAGIGGTGETTKYVS